MTTLYQGRDHRAPVEPADDLIDYQDFTELCARHSFFCDDDESAETLHEMIQEAIAADRARRPAPAGPVTPIDLDALLSPAGPYETGPDAGNADGAQLVRDRHGNPTWWAPMHGCDSLDDLLDQIRSRILPHLYPPANHFPGATEMVAPPAEGEAWEQVVWLRSLIGESVWFEPGSENASKLAHAAYVLLNQSDQIAELQRQLNRRTRPNG